VTALLVVFHGKAGGGTAVTSVFEMRGDKITIKKENEKR